MMWFLDGLSKPQDWISTFFKELIFYGKILRLIKDTNFCVEMMIITIEFALVGSSHLSNIK